MSKVSNFQENGKLIFVCLFVIWTIIFMIVMNITSKEVLSIIKTENYIEVSGKILSSDVSKISSLRSVKYSPNIWYTYSYEGKEYKNNQYRPVDNIIKLNKTEIILSEYPKGQEVSVFINASNPTQSYLVKGLRAEYILGYSLLFSVFLLWLIPLYMLISGNIYILKESIGSPSGIIYKEPTPIGFALFCLLICSLIVGIFNVFIELHYSTWNHVIGICFLYFFVFLGGYIFRSIYKEPFKKLNDWIEFSKESENWW